MGMRRAICGAAHSSVLLTHFVRTQLPKLLTTILPYELCTTSRLSGTAKAGSAKSAPVSKTISAGDFTKVSPGVEFMPKDGSLRMKKRYAATRENIKKS